MKGLVLSGGEGTRLRPISHSLPKQLMPVANRPVLEHVLCAIRDVGITEIALVVGDRQREIRDLVGDGSRLGVHVTYLHQERPRGLADGVRIAKSFLGDDDFLMYLGDNLLADGIAELADQFRREPADAQLTVHKVANPSSFGVIERAGDGAVVRVLEKPHRPPSDLAVVGVYFFRPTIHEAVERVTPSARGELEISDAVQWLIERGAAVTACEYDGFWRDVGSVPDALASNRRLLAGVSRSIRGDVDEETEITGPVVVAEGAQVRRSRLIGPVMIGRDTLVEDSQLGPDTTIGRDCRIRVAGLSDSIVLDGAVTRSSGNMSASLIGREAHVELFGETAGPCQLILGDHCRIGEPE